MTKPIWSDKMTIEGCSVDEALLLDTGDAPRPICLFLHRDPFDRLLAAQALEEGLSIVSADPVFTGYGVKRIW